ncbi:MAG: four helix bundle protein [Fidelibacterota bacterium]
MSYQSLEIWKLAKKNAIDIHKMTLKELPKFEMFETGSQIRRSSKSTVINIVEGYGRRHYKQDFIRFLNYSLASNIETINHLELLWETKSLTNLEIYSTLMDSLNLLGKKLFTFIQIVKTGHQSEK